MNKEIAATGTAYRSNAAQASIGRQLQVMYDEIVCQPLPPEVVTLMKKLEHE